MTQPKGAELLRAAAKVLRADFQRIRQTIPHAGEKGLEKADVTPMDEVVHTSPLIVTTTRGIVFAYDSAITLKRAWEVLSEFNAKVHSDLWIDEVVILDKGSISYMVHSLHRGFVAGYGKATKKVMITPVFVVPIVTEQGEYTLSHFMVNLSGHLTFYRRKSAVPFKFLADPERKVKIG